eukprot:s18_g4.t1
MGKLMQSHIELDQLSRRKISLPLPSMKMVKRRYGLLLAFVMLSGALSFVSFARGTLSCDTIAPQTNRRGGIRGRLNLLRAEPTAEERKAAQELLKDSPVGQMAGSMGQDGAQSLYLFVGVAFGFLVLFTALVLSGALGDTSGDAGSL